jgi:hypothetical protein
MLTGQKIGKKQKLIMGNREGPLKRIVPEEIIPEHTINTCNGCKYHKGGILRTGKYPKYEFNCHYFYPVVKRTDDFNTPIWCHFLNK